MSLSTRARNGAASSITPDAPLTSTDLTSVSVLGDGLSILRVDKFQY
jgi:hypothetical protein